MTKKIIALFLLFACLLPCLLLPLSAAEAELVLRDFSKTTVDTDLIGSNYKNKLGFEQKIENVEDIAELFPAKDGADASILEIMEVGYSTSQKEKSPITLYVWIYIPDPDFNPNSSYNEITLADAFTKNPLGETTQPKAEKWTADSYNQYTLSHVGASTNGAVHKFTVSGFDASGCISAGQRKYNVSRFDLHYNGKSTADNYKEGRSYIFTGSGKNLKSTADGLRVIEITNLNQTTFRYDNLADDGLVERETQISTVYFSIPAEYEAKYDELFSIKCDYDRYRSAPMITTTNEEMFKLFSQWIMKNLESYPQENKPEWGIYGISEKISAVSSSLGKHYYDWVYNETYYNNLHHETGKGSLYRSDDCLDITTLFWLFGYKGADGQWGNDDIDDAYVRYQDVLRLYENYAAAGYGTDYYDLYFNGLIRMGRTGEYGHHTEIITREKNLDNVLQGYKYSSDWTKFWDTLCGDLKETASIEGVTAIQKIYAKDYTDFISVGRKSEEVCKKYLVNSSDYDAFRDFCAVETMAGNTVIVFHFASSVYEVRDAWFFKETTGLPYDSAYYDAYMCTQDLFLNFTIIEMTFGDEYEQTVIPVNAPNINVSGGTSPGQGKGPGDVVDDTWQQILSILMLLLTIAGLALLFWGATIVLKPIFAAGEAAGRSADNARLRRELKRDRQNSPSGSTINVYIDGKKVKTKTDKPKKKPKGRKGKKR